jgi:hypothetical protein
VHTQVDIRVQAQLHQNVVHVMQIDCSRGEQEDNAREKKQQGQQTFIVHRDSAWTRGRRRRQQQQQHRDNTAAF